MIERFLDWMEAHPVRATAICVIIVTVTYLLGMGIEL
jgi:hypothetical protein